MSQIELSQYPDCLDFVITIESCGFYNCRKFSRAHVGMHLRLTVLLLRVYKNDTNVRDHRLRETISAAESPTSKMQKCKNRQ